MVATWIGVVAIGWLLYTVVGAIEAGVGAIEAGVVAI